MCLEMPIQVDIIQELSQQHRSYGPANANASRHRLRSLASCVHATNEAVQQILEFHFRGHLLADSREEAIEELRRMRCNGSASGQKSAPRMTIVTMAGEIFRAGVQAYCIEALERLSTEFTCVALLSPQTERYGQGHLLLQVLLLDHRCSNADQRQAKPTLPTGTFEHHVVHPIGANTRPTLRTHSKNVIDSPVKAPRRGCKHVGRAC